ncbi:hypothetical protein HYV49_02970 [Candidatus Pacearchaeota archaeon]|nr:hypothetical protein [Candidatus Pacearchaeota archaeon]
MKIINIFIIGILILGLLGIVLANVEDKIAKEGKLDDIDEDIDVETVATLDNETNNIVNNTLNKTKEHREKIKIGEERVTHFAGFAISGDNGEPVKGLWVSQRFERNNTNITRASGRFDIGHGDEKSKFKLLLKEFTNNSVSFYVFPIDASLERIDRENTTSNSIGTLNLDHKKYSNIVVWKGKLVLNSGSRAGTWEVTGWSRTKTIKRGDIEETRIQMVDKMERELAQAQEKVNKTREKVQERIGDAQEKGEEEIRKAEQKVERVRRWWEFWKSK